MSIFWCIILGYLVGCINPSFFIAKLKGFDIKKAGSGNAGGSNALITMGKLIGFFCIIFDIFKAFGIIKLCVYLFPAFKYSLPVTGVSCILGHMFPFYMKFRGGKGLACFGGLLLAYSPALFGIYFAVEVIISFLADYICVAPITLSISFPIVYGILEASLVAALIICVASIPMLLKHVQNIKRIRLGQEMRLSYLWKGKEEADRVLRNMEKED